MNSGDTNNTNNTNNTNLGVAPNNNVTNNLNTLPNSQPVLTNPVVTSTVPVTNNDTTNGQPVSTSPVVTPIVPVTNNATSNSTATDNTNTVNSQFTPTVVTTDNVVTEAPLKVEEDDGKKKKKKRNPNQSSSSSLTIILIIIVVVLVFYVVYSNKLYKTNLDNLRYNCTPVNSYKEDKQLSLDSTLVVDLYDKVKTSIREDYAQPEFNDNMKLYLAFRQIPQDKYYNSNCNMFDARNMEPYKCDQKTFVPKAFKEEDLIHEIKMLYGEETNLPLGNIKLQNSCIGGYMYIPQRGEFVQGECNQQIAVSYKVTKTLKEAYSNRNTITLVEEVKYHENEKLKLPEYLKSGLYYYTFRLDMNFNYVLINRTYESKY